MPTILRSGPYRFYFFSHEPSEPPNVRVDRDQDSCKVWLTPVGLSSSLGFRETLENPARSRDNGPVITDQDWADGWQAAGIRRLRAIHGQEA
ncbi:DUF4160 domain-containing protein, partial [Synechococcus sp. Cruz-9H2]